jgi:hypothetical protein
MGRCTNISISIAIKKITGCAKQDLEFEPSLSLSIITVLCRRKYISDNDSTIYAFRFKKEKTVLLCLVVLMV